MAILETIRTRGGVIITIVIGLALFAFILGDFMGPGGSSITGSKMDIAKVKGKGISYLEYEAKIEELSEIVRLNNGSNSLDEASMEYIREQAFEMMISERILSEEYEKLGLTVTGLELFDLVQGEDPHPAIRQMFTDPQTGMFNRSVLISFLQNKNDDATGQQQQYWRFMENQILNDQLINKYVSLVEKGLYVPGYMVRNEARANGVQADFDFLVQRYASIPDSSVQLTTSDLKKYYDEHLWKWEQLPSRDIEYVAFQLLPSEKDRADAQEWIQNIVPEFEATPNNAQFLSLHSDAPYVSRNYTQDELPVQAASLFDAAPGTIAGPYEESNTLKLVKLIQEVSVPDSVMARHILVQPQANTQIAMAEARSLADSLKNVVERGGNFAALAMSFSSDQASMVDGGNLGWFQEGMMVSEFNNAAFSLSKGEVAVVETQFGYHVLQVTDRSQGRKKVQVAILEKEIAPSSETYQKLYSQASQFAAEHRTGQSFTDATSTGNFNSQFASYLRENDRRVGTLGEARSLVRWAFQSKMNEVSDVFSLDQAYVVARVAAVRDEEQAPLNQVKNEIEVEVLKLKKADILIAKLNEAANNNSLQSIASQLGTPVESATGISFATFSIPAGIEPKVVAAASSLAPNTLSDPIAGTNGVYLLQVQAVSDTLINETEARTRLIIAREARASNETFQTLRTLSKVKDMRSKFY